MANLIKMVENNQSKVGRMYILKIKGTAKIPDYIQIRDEKFTLIGYFRADRPDKGLKKMGLGDHLEAIKEQIEELSFGKMQKLKVYE